MSGRPRGQRTTCLVAIAVLALSAGCQRDPQAAQHKEEARQEAARLREGIVTISGDDSISETLTWRAPDVVIADKGEAQAARRADAALKSGNLYADAQAAIPLYQALSRRAPDNAAYAAGLQRALKAVIAAGDADLDVAEDDIAALRRAHTAAAVARSVAPDDAAVAAFLERIDAADTLWELNRDGEHALAKGQYGERGGGALAAFRKVLAIAPKQPRAMQGLAATESAMIRRAEEAGETGDFAAAQRWLGFAARVRPDSRTVPDAVVRVERMRNARIAQLRDRGIAALPQRNGLQEARERLAEILLIARAGDPVAAELRVRIDLAEHYGPFRPGQSFTDGLAHGGRGPEMIVVPHGAFRMGAPETEAASADNERPQRNIRFDRGFALSVHEVTIAEYRVFVNATSRKTRATRRGFSLVYDPRSGNFTRRSGVGWMSDYIGGAGRDDQPVLHVSAKDADAYADWLSRQIGKRYRLPSEAEFEYVLRAGGDSAYPWGRGRPPGGAGNFAGARDTSPSGLHWSNAFAGYGDGYWGPAPASRFAANRWGLHDLAGNVSEWVADCWHDSYRRAPKDGAAWVNPGCRTRVVRGGSWASSPQQTRSAWRGPIPIDTTNARIGFRVARDI